MQTLNNRITLRNYQPNPSRQIAALLALLRNPNVAQRNKQSIPDVGQQVKLRESVK